MRGLDGVSVLIVEDGDEYLASLSQFVHGPRYSQARSAVAAIAALRAGGVDLVYLDMRFDRVPLSDLAGDHAALARDLGDVARAWRHLQKNQGAYILAALAEAGFAEQPVVLAHDLGREPARSAHLRSRHPRLVWVPDVVSAEEIAAAMRTALAG